MKRIPRLLFAFAFIFILASVLISKTNENKIFAVEEAVSAFSFNLTTAFPTASHNQQTSDNIDYDISGNCGDNATWTFDKDSGVLTIEGHGKIDSNSTNVWSSWKPHIKSIVIKEGITEIDLSAFSYCTNLKSVDFGKISAIGDYAFLHCTSLTSIKLPDTVKSIGFGVFQGCTSLKDFSTGNSLKEITTDMFNYCTLESFHVGRSLKNFDSVYTDTTYIRTKKFIVEPLNLHFSSDENGLLYNKKKTSLLRYPTENTTEVFVLPDETTRIDELALSYCSNIKTIVLHERFEGWSYELYNGCHISDIQFNNCPKLEKIIVSSESPYFSSNEDGILFSKDKTKLIKYPMGKIEETYEIPSCVSIISEYAFFGNKHITHMDFPEGITEIHDSSFYSCHALRSISIPSSVINVDSWAFRYCPELAEINISDDARGFYHNSFEGTAYTENINNWENGILYIGKHLITVSESTDDKITVKKGTLSISSCAFSDKIYLENIVLPDTIEYIGSSAFSNCIALRSIQLPNNLNYIDIGAFYHCASLESVAIPEGVQKVSFYAFAECNKLNTVSIPKSVKEIDSNAFSDTYSITDVYYNGCKNCWDEIAIVHTYDDNRVVNLPAFENEESITFHFSDDGHPATKEDPPAEDPPVQETYYVNIVNDILSLHYKQTKKLDTEANRTVSYTSSDTSVATVDSEGNVTAVSNGTTIITATIEGSVVYDSCEVTVSYAWWQWIIRIFLLGFIWY